MTMLAMNDVDTMRDSVLFDGPNKARRISRFWILIILASIIASAGVVGDSTATVIGAMIVAPLMTPILGTMLSLVLADRANLIRSLLFVVGGAACAVAIGWLVGLVVLYPVVAATNSQVAARVHPHLIDLLAAVATGVVGSISLIRKDISDTLPGVAIAISLVPPLSVVGLTLQSGEPGEAFGALLLFLTNVTAILASGIIVMAIYKVRPPEPSDEDRGRALNRRRAMLVVGALTVSIVGVLTFSSAKIIRDTRRESTVQDVAKSWAGEFGWRIIAVSTDEDGLVVRAEGPIPQPETTTLADALRRRGIDPAAVTIDLVPRVEIKLGG
jgi:uncharacterized hydrophobic protein (TIGR00271 family)